MKTIRFYCPFCRSQKPMWKAGFRRMWSGDKRQQYKCKECHRLTINPRKSKPRVKK